MELRPSFIWNTEWRGLLEDEFQKPYFISLNNFLSKEDHIVPKKSQIFKALDSCPYSNVKVVILGQDPYPYYQKATGLAFAVSNNHSTPPSLRNIMKEVGLTNFNKELIGWTQQGVLLLNTSLTVRLAEPLSHSEIGWTPFTDKIISLINDKDDPVVFMLWGAKAKLKQSLITNPKHLILTAPHPSGLSAYKGFIGCNHFNLANEYLKLSGKQEIDWSKTNE